MKWMPELRRTITVGEGAMIVLVLSVGAAFFSSLVIEQSMPFLTTIVFGILPYVATMFIGLTAVLTFLGRERIESASARAASILSIAVLVSFLLSLFGGWSREAEENILSPRGALSAMLTGGIFPLHAGLDPLVRFLPVMTALGTAIALMRRASFFPIIIGVFGWYVASSLLFYALSWVAGIVAFPESLQTNADTFRVLLGAQRDGYWTLFQQERFFAPVGRQVETSFAAIEATILFIASAIATGFLFWRSVSASAVLLKRLVTRSVGAFALVAVVGLAASLAHHQPTPSYTDLLSQIVFLIVMVAWLLAWRLQRDLENFSRDVESHPSLPLPSGEVTPHDVERVIVCTNIISSVGAILLGWRVALPLLVASGVSWFFSKRGLGWGSTLWGRSTGVVLIAYCLAMTALNVGLRHLPSTDMLARLVLAAALLIGIAELFCFLRDEVDSRIPVAFGVLVLVLMALSVSRQSVLLYLTIPFALVWLWIAHKPSLWHRFGSYPLYGLLAGILFVELFFSSVLTLS